MEQQIKHLEEIKNIFAAHLETKGLRKTPNVLLFWKKFTVAPTISMQKVYTLTCSKKSIM
jgi:hypothetical protein